MYLGRACYDCDVLPAHINHDTRIAHVVYAGSHHQVAEYVFMRGMAEDALQWRPSSNGEILPLAVIGGRTERYEALYIGRRLQETPTGEKKWLLGKVHPSHHVLYVNVNGTETAFDRYEILVWLDAKEAHRM